MPRRRKYKIKSEKESSGKRALVFDFSISERVRTGKLGNNIIYSNFTTYYPTKKGHFPLRSSRVKIERK